MLARYFNNIDHSMNYQLEQSSSLLDFRALVTHESGHLGGLSDLGTSSSPACSLNSVSVWTMCQGVPIPNQYNQRSLQADDINAMEDGWDNDPST